MLYLANTPTRFVLLATITTVHFRTRMSPFVLLYLRLVCRTAFMHPCSRTHTKIESNSNRDQAIGIFYAISLDDNFPLLLISVVRFVCAIEMRRRIYLTSCLGRRLREITTRTIFLCRTHFFFFRLSVVGCMVYKFLH